MDTDTSMEKDRQLHAASERTPEGVLHEMLFLLRVYCNLTAELPKAKLWQPVRKGIDFVRIMQDHSLTGMPDEKWDRPLENKVLVFDDDLALMHNCLMMKYGYSERLETIFYWTTELKTHYFDPGKQR